MDNIIKETMLSLEGAALRSAREKYFDYVADSFQEGKVGCSFRNPLDARPRAPSGTTDDRS